MSTPATRTEGTPTERLIAALGGSPEGAATVARHLVKVARAAEGHRFPSGPAGLPYPFKRTEDLNAWASGATSIVANYIAVLATLAPMAGGGASAATDTARKVAR